MSDISVVEELISRNRRCLNKLKEQLARSGDQAPAIEIEIENRVAQVEGLELLRKEILLKIKPPSSASISNNIRSARAWHPADDTYRASLATRDLRGTDLKSADLAGFDLRWANLSGANLSHADLSEANLQWANLERANLSQADLKSANLRGANLEAANLSEAILSGARIEYVILSQASLEMAQFDDVTLRNVYLNGANLAKVSLVNARRMSGVHLRGAFLPFADLRGVNLGGADLSWSNLSQADLSGANLNETDLDGANLSGAILDFAKLRWAYFGKTVFGNNNLGSVYGLESVYHLGDSYIDTRTIENSIGRQKVIMFLYNACVKPKFMEVAANLTSQKFDPIKKRNRWLAGLDRRLDNLSHELRIYEKMMEDEEIEVSRFIQQRIQDIRKELEILGMRRATL